MTEPDPDRLRDEIANGDRDPPPGWPGRVGVPTAIAKERPILFSAPMVRALLDGRKKQTRRILGKSRKGHMAGVNLFDGTWSDSYVLDPGNAEWRDRFVRFVVGDRLWVRETWRTTGDDGRADYLSPAKVQPHPLWYEADGLAPADQCVGKKRPAIFMPRWASRLTLPVTDVRVQRLRDITPEDAIREGYPFDAPPASGPGTYIAWYRDLWNSINGDASWEGNPWVVAISFTVEKR